MTIFGTRLSTPHDLQFVREMLDLSENKAAHHWGVTRQAYSKWEERGAPRGPMDERAQALSQICTIFTRNLRREIVPQILAAPIPGWGGRSIRQALLESTAFESAVMTRNLLYTGFGTHDNAAPGSVGWQIFAKIGLPVTSADTRTEGRRSEAGAVLAQLPIPQLPAGFSCPNGWQHEDRNDYSDMQTFKIELLGPQGASESIVVQLDVDGGQMPGYAPKRIFAAFSAAVASIRESLLIVA